MAKPDKFTSPFGRPQPPSLPHRDPYGDCLFLSYLVREPAPLQYTASRLQRQMMDDFQERHRKEAERRHLESHRKDMMNTYGGSW